MTGTLGVLFIAIAFISEPVRVSTKTTTTSSTSTTVTTTTTTTGGNTSAGGESLAGMAEPGECVGHSGTEERYFRTAFPEWFSDTPRLQYSDCWNMAASVARSGSNILGAQYEARSHSCFVLIPSTLRIDDLPQPLRLDTGRIIGWQEEARNGPLPPDDSTVSTNDKMSSGTICITNLVCLRSAQCNPFHHSEPSEPGACECSSDHPQHTAEAAYCASRSFDHQGRTCTRVREPGDNCPAGFLRCATPDAAYLKVPQTGTRCGCQEFSDGARGDDTLLCVSFASSSQIKCGLPLRSGVCQANQEPCVRHNAIRIEVSKQNRRQVLQERLAIAAGVHYWQIKIISVCPASACPNGVCPRTLEARSKSLCTVNFTLGRGSILEMEDKVYVDFDIVDTQSELQRSNAVAQIFDNTARISSGKPPDPDNQSQETLAGLHASGVRSVLPMVERTTGPELGQVEEGQKTWMQRFWWVLPCVIGLLVVGTVIAKKRVWFSDAVDFAASRKSETRELRKGMEGCYRAHKGDSKARRNRSRSTGSDASMQEICIDALPEESTDYLPFPEANNARSSTVSQANSFAFPVYQHQLFHPAAPKLLSEGRVIGINRMKAPCRSRSASSSGSSGSSEPEVSL